MMIIPADREARDELLTRYVLDDLPPAEARAIAAAAAADPELARELGELRAALGALAYATVTAPPSGLRDRVLDAAAPAPTPTANPRIVTWRRMLGAVAAALILALGLDDLRVRRDLALQHDLMTTLQQPNVLLSFALTGVGSDAVGRVVLDLDAKKAAVVIHDLPTPRTGEVYRLWARVGDQHVPCGNLAVASDGTVQAQLPIPVDAYTSPVRALVLTRETARDAAAPQGAEVMRSS